MDDKNFANCVKMFECHVNNFRNLKNEKPDLYYRLGGDKHLKELEEHLKKGKELL